MAGIMAKSMNKNRKPPPDVYISLLLPTLRCLSKTAPHTGSCVCGQLRKQTKALGSQKHLPDLESTDFANAVRTTLKILVALGYAQLMPRIIPWEERKYLLTALGAELIFPPRPQKTVPARVVRQVQTLCTENSTTKGVKKLKKQADAFLNSALLDDSPSATEELQGAHLRDIGKGASPTRRGASAIQDASLDAILKASDSPVIHAQAEFAERFTQDLIRHIHAVTPEYFEHIVADIFTALGFYTEVTGGADDKGVDVIARYSDGLDFAPIYIQVKHYCGTIKVTPTEIQKLAGAVFLHGGLQGVLVTCGTFAHPVPKYLQGLPGAHNIALIDQHKLVGLMIHHRIGVRKGKCECSYSIDKEYFEPGMAP